MSTRRKHQWFSALLVYLLDSPKDRAWRKALRSLIVFQARDFTHAHKLANAAGEKTAKEKSILESSGTPEIRLTFCYVETLDIVGRRMEMSEVWSQISSDARGLKPDPDRTPSQTI